MGHVPPLVSENIEINGNFPLIESRLGNKTQLQHINKNDIPPFLPREKEKNNGIPAFSTTFL
jgi:hypothetical protein